MAAALAAASAVGSKATMAARPAGSEVDATTATLRSHMVAACSAVSTTLPLLGSTTTSAASRLSTAATSSAALGFMD